MDDDGFISEYLDDVPDEHRDVVQTVLRRYRKDSDRNIQGKLDEYQARLSAYEGNPRVQNAVQLYEYLLDNPDEALRYVAEQAETQLGAEGLRSKLAEEWSVGGEDGGSSDEVIQSGLTEEELTQHMAALRTGILQEIQQQETVREVNGTINQIARKAGIEQLTPSQLSYFQSAGLEYMQTGQASTVEDAISKAVHDLTGGFGAKPTSTAEEKRGGSHPRVASGGSAGPAEFTLDKAQLANKNSRQELMLSRLPS